MSVVLTGWAGTQFGEMAAHTVPVLHRYATRHGLAFECANLAGNRPASWMKVHAIYAQLQNADRVVWIDADVVVLDDSRNIFDELRDGWQAMVEHHTPSGQVPNCGVWVVTRHMIPVLEHIWHAGRNVTHPWWEQASMLEQMGYQVVPGPIAQLAEPTELWHRTTWLGPEWNHHPHDQRRVALPRFVHVTQYTNRLDAVKHYTGVCRGRTA